MSNESRRIHRGMIEPAFPPTQSVVPPIPRRGMTRRAFCAGAAFLAAAGTLSLAGCNSLPFTGAAPVRLVIKVPRTGHDVVFDDSISQVETVIQGMAEGFQRDYERPVDVEVVVFEQNQYDEAVKGSFDTDKAPDVLYGDYFNISTYIRTGRVVPLDDVVAPAIRDDLFDDLWNMGVVEGRGRRGVAVAPAPEAVVEIAELAVGAERRLGGDVERAVSATAKSAERATLSRRRRPRFPAGGATALWPPALPRAAAQGALDRGVVEVRGPDLNLQRRGALGVPGRDRPARDLPSAELREPDRHRDVLCAERGQPPRGVRGPHDCPLSGSPSPSAASASRSFMR